MAGGADRLVLMVARVPDAEESLPLPRQCRRSRALRRAFVGQAHALARTQHRADRGCRAAGIPQLGHARRRDARAEARARDHRLRRELHLQLGQVLRRFPAVSPKGDAAAVVLPPPRVDPHRGPPPHVKGPLVFLDYDQIELDAAYDQAVYQPNILQLNKRWASNSARTRARIGEPLRRVCGESAIEQLDIFRTSRDHAPIFIFIHGGAWIRGEAKSYAAPAEMFIHAGAHYVVPDFINVGDAGGSLFPMAEQVRRAIAWVYRNADSFGGDPERIYIGGQSSGAHLTAVALTTDWQVEFGLPAGIVKGGLCTSGMYELAPVRLSA